MHVPGAHSDVAQAHVTSALHPAGRAAHENWAAGQPAKHPGGPPSGQLGVAVLPGGQAPPSGTGLQVSAPQFCLPTHTWPDVQVASPQVSVTSVAASPLFDPSPDLQPAMAATAATTSAAK